MTTKKLLTMVLKNSHEFQKETNGEAWCLDVQLRTKDPKLIKALKKFISNMAKKGEI